MADQPISSHSIEDLTDHFGQAVSKPGWRPWLRGMDKVEGISVKGVKIGRIGELWREITSGSRHSFATCEWLRPRVNSTLDELERIRRGAGLEHLDASEFVSAICERCKEFSQNYPRLRLWIERQLALLEYRLTPPTPVADDLRLSGLALRAGLLPATASLSLKDADSALKQSQIIASTALECAARAALHILGKDPTSTKISANIMVRVNLPGPNGPGFTCTATAVRNAATAASLWAPIVQQASQALVAVAETEQAGHDGFWIPLTDFAGVPLPGAPAALKNMEGSAVFKDDLPALTGFPRRLQDDWKSYILHDFMEDMFVSLPFLVPQSVVGLPIVAAILNVNSVSHDKWRRAHHRPWLIAARDQVAPFVEAAFGAVRIQNAAREMQGMRGVMQIDTGSAIWNSLPGTMGGKMALPDGGGT